MKKQLFISLIFILILTSSVFGATVLQGENLNINNFTEENIYAVSNSINVTTDVPKDLFAIGSKITINKDVEQDFNAIGSEVVINGNINEDVRIVGSRVIINGDIGAEALLIGSEIVISDETVVDSDLRAIGSIVTINGKVMGDTHIRATELSINNDIYGDANIASDKLEFGKKGLIKGNLKVNEALEFDKEKIEGTIQHIKEKKTNFSQQINSIIFNFLALLFIGLIILYLFRKPLETTKKQLSSNGLKCLLAGLITLIGIPIIGFILMFTVIGVYAALFLLLVYLLAIMFSFIIVPYYFGEKIAKLFSTKSKILALIFGLILLFILTNLPFIGGLVVFAVLVFGMGSFILYFKNLTKKSRNK